MDSLDDLIDDLKEIAGDLRLLARNGSAGRVIEAASRLSAIRDALETERLAESMMLPISKLVCATMNSNFAQRVEALTECMESLAQAIRASAGMGEG